VFLRKGWMKHEIVLNGEVLRKDRRIAQYFYLDGKGNLQGLNSFDHLGFWSRWLLMPSFERQKRGQACFRID